MKALLTLSFLFLFSNIFSQEEAGSFYLHFLHPNFYNPSIQLSDSLITVNSNSIWKGDPRGFNSFYGGIQIPNEKLKSNLGFNLFSINNRNYHFREAGVNYNWIILSSKKISLTTGAEIGLRSQSYFWETRNNPSLSVIKEHGNSTYLNGGISIIWKSLLIGFSCRNCSASGFKSDFRTDEEINHKKFYLNGSYKRQINKSLSLRIDAVARNFYYFQLADITVSGLFFNKFHLGGSWRDEFPVNWAIHGGFKWKNYFFYGVFQPENRRHASAIELAAQLQFHHLRK